MTQELKIEPSSMFLLPELSALGDAVCHVLQLGVEEELLGESILNRVQSLIAAKRVTSSDVVRLALLNDALRVTEAAITANGNISDDEVKYAVPLVEATAKRLNAFRSYYSPLSEPTLKEARDFLEIHRPDRQLFGGACVDTRWLGLEIVRRVAQETGDRAPLDQYSELMVRLSEEIVAIDGSSAPTDKVRRELEERLGLRKLLTQAQNSAPPPGEDPRVRAFCSPDAPEVFHAIAHANQIWKRDPLDVESVHQDVRSLFSRLIDRAAQQTDGGTGRILLVLGEAGAGKTHLMRAFRERAHSQRSGYVGYMQMSAAPDDYARYVLVNLLESLEKPYDEPGVQRSGLMCLSEALVTAPISISPEQRRKLVEDELSDDDLCTMVFKLADAVVTDPRFSDMDLDVLRAFLFLQRREPPLYARVMKWLRCEPMGRRDLAMIGDLAPRSGPDDALRQIANLAKLMARTDGGALVLLIDQLEDIYHQENAKDRFTRVLDVVRHVSDHVPNGVVVLSCLRDFYMEMKKHVTRSVLDRVEKDPEPHALMVGRSLGEIEALVERRLAHLYESQGVRHRPEQPWFPYERAQLEKVVGLSARDAFNELHAYQNRCVAAGRLVDDSDGVAPTPPVPASEPDTFGTLWAAHKAELKTDVPDDEDALLELLRSSLRALGDELPEGKKLGLDRGPGGLVVTPPEKPAALVHITNKRSMGGGLTKQLETLLKAANTAKRTPVAVRSSDFGGTIGSALVRHVASIKKISGRCVTATNADWRTLLAHQSFVAKHGKDAGFQSWARRERPLMTLDLMRNLLGFSEADIDALDAKTKSISPEPIPEPEGVRGPDVLIIEPVPDPIYQPPVNDGPFKLGRTVSLNAQPVSIDPQVLKRHCAFLGAPGSGKTSLALNVIEHLVERDVGAILIDRKGDLAPYADPEWWDKVDPDPARDRRKRDLRAHAHVRLFTPGNPKGRSLRIRAVPEGIGKLPSHERTQIAQFAAQGLGTMMGFKGTAKDNTSLAILGKSIEVLAQLTTKDVGLRELIDLLAEQDDSLVAELGHLDPKLFKKIVEGLETLRLNHGALLNSTDEPLRAETLLGKDGTVPPGKTPITIISTKFLGDAERVDFWISQLLVEMSRYCSRSPAATLQSVLFLDEADIYLPATSKPATKEPLIDLLKRARSAGLGVMLATQNPGDLDYKARDNITTWWLGKIGSKTAIEKMRPLLSECKTDVSASLATASVGEFFQVSDGGAVVRMRSERALMDTAQVSEETILELSSLARI